ncbi:hypothetical protein CRU87_07470 [Aliarcobacter trophiarum LMG 25534]|uniref:Uncharacterized protein n=1 Tax=Aliarcobacter trophiarum LMG 25534 TaxID=1032241 RepID=A0ABY0EXY7_9BACT|nr:hypothetical protein [Aliarcobacter trophiarum]RXI27737.1 hypothetical protein CRU89_04665 [Aliarcobacter trophiarum]RXJ90119.1 hypothetical protein CRU87_07470 [Aliarcobacter trophiarum LMG 25534]
MKINKFLNNIEEFFEINKKEEESLLEAIQKLEDKKIKLLEKINKEDFKEENRQNLEDKLKMVDDLKRKIEKKIVKINLKRNIE